MKPEIAITYILTLKRNYKLDTLLELRYSTDAIDRVRYEMLVLTCSTLGAKTLGAPSGFSDFLETLIVLPKNLMREKFHSLMKV